jgi:hypothetical protein
VLLACVMPVGFWNNLPAVGAYLLLVVLTCLTTATIALFCSVLFRKTSVSLMTTYLTIVVLFTAPLAIRFFAETFFPNAPAAKVVRQIGVASPFAAAFAVPLKQGERDTRPVFDNGPAASSVASNSDEWQLYFGHILFVVILNTVLLGTMVSFFNTRWRVSE